jgi:hypothetical protein
MNPYAVALYAMLVALRAWGLWVRWRLPEYRGDGFFFDAALDAETRARFVRNYRTSLLTTGIPFEVAMLVDFVMFGSVTHVAFIHGPMTIALGFLRKLSLRSLVLEARAQSAGEAQPVALSLTPRRASNYSNAPFETINLLATVIAIAAIVRAPWPPYLLAGAVLYTAIGFWLWKRSLARRPVVLPAEGADEYLQLTEDAFRASMRQLDLVRGCCTLVLVLIAAKTRWWQWFERYGDTLARVTMAALVVFGLISVIASTRRGRALMQRAKSLNVPSLSRRRLADPENLHLGGFIYCNPDNPAVVVDGGPLHMAVNVLNKVTYVYVIYWAGWAMLVSMAARAW